ncbi:YlbD family protein [Bacillus sp. FJAT-47783]|uniref:YlbD family protein n=1 Tax=Bacillus sp. FJAT-47783 TaxID=2922712 RepID=UPI001FAE0B74|nr:YlbD family protein [Bacillus sp. FJAT-47783]
MTKKSVHPTVQQFKEFVKEHPKLIEAVRKGEKDWKDIFEDWRLLGADDPTWKKYKETESEKSTSSEGKSSFFTALLSSVKKMDADQLNENIYKMNNAISSIQELLQQFSQGKSQDIPSNQKRNQPFMFRKD